MKPTATQLIDAARLALEEHVAPEAKGELAASAIRSVTMILKHLAVRSEIEADILWVEHVALKNLLQDAAHTLENLQHAPGDQLAIRITAQLSGSAVAASEYPSAALLDEENTALRALLDELLVTILSVPEGSPGGEDLQSLHGRIREHLLAQNRRERDLYFPVFTGPPV